MKIAEGFLENDQLMTIIEIMKSSESLFEEIVMQKKLMKEEEFWSSFLEQETLKI